MAITEGGPGGSLDLKKNFLTIIHTLPQMLMLNALFKSKCKTKSLVISSRSVSFILLIFFF